MHQVQILPTAKNCRPTNHAPAPTAANTQATNAIHAGAFLLLFLRGRKEK